MKMADRKPRIEAIPSGRIGELTCERCDEVATVYVVIWDDDEGWVDFECCGAHGLDMLSAESD